MQIDTTEALRALYPPAGERARVKEIHRLEQHSRHFISLCPFIVLSTCDADFNLDASPRGGEPGFVKVVADDCLLIPDSPGNNRLDSIQNILSTGRVGLLFMIPGVDETLRVNGRARISVADADRDLCADARRVPKAVIRVEVQAAYLHCAKAFMRSKLWSPDARVERSVLPTIGEMIADQTGLNVPIESQEAMQRRYAADL